MAEPTSALSYKELITEVARVAGCAYYGTTGLLPAMPPIDNNTFDEIRGIVNRGIKMFIANTPVNGWKWRHRKMAVTFAPSFTGTATAGTATSLTNDDIAGDYADDYFLGFTIGITAGTGIGETAVITDYTGLTGKFDFSGGLSDGSTPDTTSEYRISRSLAVVTGDPARYQLDEDFGAVESQIAYAANSNRGTQIQWSGEAVIRKLRSITVNTGTPKLATIRPYGTRRFEMIVDPTPTEADVVEFMYKVIFDKLDGETGIATGGSTTTLVDDNQAYRYADDYFKGWTLTILAGTGAGESTVLTGSTGASGTFTFALAAITTPDATSVYMVEPPSNLHPASIEFDDAILAACRAMAQMELEDAEGDNWIQYYYNSALPSAHKIDAKLSPRRLVRSKGIEHERTWEDVTYD